MDYEKLQREIAKWDAVARLVREEDRRYWKKLQKDDHMVTLDHKDEKFAAEVIVAAIDATRKERSDG